MPAEEAGTVLILGANSDVAKEMLRLYVQRGDKVIAASRNLAEIEAFVAKHQLPAASVDIRHWDAVDFASHRAFYDQLPEKPSIVVYAAGYLVHTSDGLVEWPRTYQMMNVHYAGAVSMLNIVVMDAGNDRLRQIIGLSSLSGVRGRKSNFIYGSTKAAFTTYLAGLRQYLAPRRIRVNAIIAGYIRSKMTAGLNLPESLMLEPEFIARASVNAGRRFVIVPGWKWKIIYRILKMLPESLVARLP
ncbi:MAG: SDR family NAD(P)-dependent oxidoreductase [Bacteroidia bacterium]